MQARNIDAILSGQDSPVTSPSPVTENPTPENKAADEIEVSADVPQGTSEPEESGIKEVPEKEVPQKPSEFPVDEYGNPIQQPKLYTDEDVQRIVRERLSRGRHSRESQEVSPKTEAAPAANAADGDWEAELERFVDRTIQKRESKYREEEWRRKEEERQAVFESRFTSGMSRYPDFREVVGGKPITDSMLIATRNLENPAAFLYGAAKLHASEIDRISRIDDPYTQALEVGRLHERMVREKKLSSSAARPLESPKGDLPQAVHRMPSLEDRINEYAKQKRK